MSPRRALKALARSPVDLVIVQWPGRGNWAAAFCRQVVDGRRPGTSFIVAIVSPPDPEALRPAIDVGASDVILWPVDRRLLHARISYNFV